MKKASDNFIRTCIFFFWRQVQWIINSLHWSYIFVFSYLLHKRVLLSVFPSKLIIMLKLIELSEFTMEYPPPLYLQLQQLQQLQQLPLQIQQTIPQTLPALNPYLPSPLLPVSSHVPTVSGFMPQHVSPSIYLSNLNSLQAARENILISAPKVRFLFFFKYFSRIVRRIWKLFSQIISDILSRVCHCLSGVNNTFLK